MCLAALEITAAQCNGRGVVVSEQLVTLWDRVGSAQGILQTRQALAEVPGSVPEPREGVDEA